MADSLKKKGRGYRPTVEVLEALRLFHAAVPELPEIDHAPLEFAAVVDAPSVELRSGSRAATDAWDAAIEATLADRLGLRLVEVDAADFDAGMSQLDRYLGRTWLRAGIAPSKHDDCTQAVYLTLLQTLGRPGFERLVGQVGESGIRDVLARENPDGLSFFRAIDAAKKRAQRERSLTSIDDSQLDPVSPRVDHDLRRTIGEAIERSLNPREAELIRSTLAGESPAEIAERWGVAPKTISNEKTRVLTKLRTFLQPSLVGA